ncbi:MAG: 50S ribosomal protein L18 [Ignavibacteriae bacterium HGW-Ignavibacteriae-3]|nr:MAG: 50S ribosomal protein L18 [Ignavibacteriae bacterium HGW-Ignavibacteriae-3]
MFLKNTTHRATKKARIRRKISGTAERPRLTVFRSANQMYAQLIDDIKGTTLVEASSLSKELAEELKSSKGKISKSKAVGKLLAKKAIEKGITVAVFDRSGYRYHGRVQAVAEGTREGGVKL